MPRTITLVPLPLLDRLVTFGLLEDVMLNATPLDEADWRALLEAASQERVLTLLVAAVDARRLAVTEQQRADVTRVATGLSLAALAQEHAIAQLVDRLGAVGIEWRLLKGHGSAALLYPDPRWRQSGDVDLAVRADEFSAAVSALLKAGAQSLTSYELGPHFSHLEKALTFRLPDGVEVDVHRRIHGEVGRYGITERDVFGEPRLATVGAATVLVPSLEVALVHAAIHLSSVRTRLSTLADLVRLAHRPELDIERSFAVGARGGALPVLVWALRRADTLWPLPGALRTRLDQLRFRRADRLAASLVLDRPSCRVLVQVADEPRRRWPGLARDVLWPSRDFLGAAHRSRVDHLRHIAGAVTLPTGAQSTSHPTKGVPHHGA